MHDLPVIKDIVVIFLISVPIIFLFRKINVPSIVGFLLAGVIIGPYGLKLISSTSGVEVMAEIGVMLLLFSIGLEVSISRLAQIKKFLIIAGGLQVLLTILLTTIISLLIGLLFIQSLFIGMLVSLSSTAIVLKLLSDNRELGTPHGRMALGISIFQDLAIVPMLLLLPVLGAGENLSVLGLIIQIIFAFGAVALILLLAKVIMPKIVYHLAVLRVREVFTVGILLLLLGTAYLTQSLGLSFALGAFIAGLILSESEFSHQVVSDILPFKDVFNSLFFVSVGLLLDISFVLEFPLMLIALVVIIVLLKSFVIVFIAFVIKYPLRTGILAGLALAQVGEFSFVLALSGSEYQFLDEFLYNAFLASSIFTMIITPFLLKFAPSIAFRGAELKPVNVSPEKDTIEALADHVIIVGFGLNGRNLARVLKETGIKYLVVEMNPDTVRTEREKGEMIIYGDITRHQLIEHLNIHSAKVIVFAISDPASMRRGIQNIRRVNPGIYTIARTRFVSEVDELIKLGADEVIPEEFETSLQLFSKVLEKYHIPLNIIMQQVALLRGESYKLMRKETTNISSFVHLDEILAAGLTDTFYVNEDNPNIGKSLKELDLRARTNATVIAIVRGEKNITNPLPTEKIMKADTLVITGTHAAVDKAFDLLSK
ncbi:MAG: monovalent cation:proton antiporter-2 (CPA2) family protein [Ignavibacteriaceae bacterium]